MNDLLLIGVVVALVLLIWRFSRWGRTRQRHVFGLMTQAEYRYALIFKENTTVRNLAGALTPARARREWRAKRRADRARARYEAAFHAPAARKRAR